MNGVWIDIVGVGFDLGASVDKLFVYKDVWISWM